MTTNKNLCPLCIKANHCTQEQGRCWCMSDDLQFPSDLLELANEIDAQRCICEQCARLYSSGALPNSKR